MEWYYSDNGQQAGPYGEGDFNDLVEQGKIQEDTLVWREGMTDWLPYGQVAGTIAASASIASATAATSADGTVVCNECGNTFPKNEVVRYGDQNVCASCKPVFVQKLKEGVLPAGDYEYAGFWIRVAAKIVDGLILGIPLVIVALVLGFASGTFSNPNAADPDFELFQVFVQLAFYGVNFFYTTFFLWKYQATPGKMVCKIRVIVSDGSDISYPRAVGRFFAEILSGMICYIGYIIAAFDQEKRSLHDHICSTRVIYRR